MKFDDINEAEPKRLLVFVLLSTSKEELLAQISRVGKE